MAWFQSFDPELESAKNAALADNWWVVALRGVLAILFGIVAFVAPAATMLALVLFFAAYCLVDGILGVVLAVRGARKDERWGWLLLNGLLGIAIGVMAALWPGITVLAFVFMIAAWALLSGGLMLGAAISLKVSHGYWLLVFGAIVSLLYGLLLFAAPLIGALVLTWWVGSAGTGLWRDPDRPRLQAARTSGRACSYRHGGARLSHGDRHDRHPHQRNARSRLHPARHAGSDLVARRACRQAVILAFYPADWSPVCGDQMACTTKSCPSSAGTARSCSAFRSTAPGVTRRSRTIEAAFPLLADFEPKGAVARAYGVYRKARA